MGRVTIAAVALVMLTAGCGERTTRTDTSGVPIPPKPVREFLGEHAVAVLSDPQKVEVYRVRDRWRSGGNPPPADVPQVAGYELVATGRAQGADFGRRLAAIFLSKEPYLFDTGKGCMFNADTVLRVHGAEGARADFVLCFTCKEFRLTAYHADGTRAPGGGAQYFDAAEGKLKSLLDSAF